MIVSKALPCYMALSALAVWQHDLRKALTEICTAQAHRVMNNVYG